MEFLSSPAAWQTALKIGHLVGFVLGVGAATASDALFFRALRDRAVSEDELGMLKAASRVVVGGLSLLVLSGAGFLALEYALSGSVTPLARPGFQAKMTIVAVLIANGVVFHRRVLPFLAARAGKSLADDAFAAKLPLFAVTGGISVVSWYSALFLGALRHSIDLPYPVLLNLYLVLVGAGIFGGHVMLSRAVFGEKAAAPRSRRRSVLLAGAVLAAVLLASAAALLLAPRTPPRAATHEVCIGERPPWFVPEVLEIAPGDTVVWRHCHEEAQEAHGRIVHTHPVLSIEGPERFTSNLRPVGHDDGETFAFRFEKPGVYRYLCPTHPYMKGIVAVGVPSPVASLWPPEEIIRPSLLPPPAEPGVGEVWIDTQFEDVPGQPYPGTITVVDAASWEVKDVIAHPTFNNPHNNWQGRGGRHVYQTQWHSDVLTKLDAATREVVATVRLGNAPAHVFVHPRRDRVYVTINNENRVVILNEALERLGEIRTSFGPHGIWIDPSGRWMSVAATLEEKLDIIDLEREEVVASFDAPGLPLATAITHDGRYAMISLLLEGKVRFVDLGKLSVVKDVEVGKMPIWPSPAPDGRHVFVPNTGTADISVISLETLEVVKTLPAAGGAHGIIFGPKRGGGHYGYFSSKFARVMGIVDADALETVGYVRLPETAWGGNGILSLPNAYDAFIPLR